MDTLLFNFHDVILMVTTYQCVLFALLLLLNRNVTLSPILLALFFLWFLLYRSNSFLFVSILINFNFS